MKTPLNSISLIFTIAILFFTSGLKAQSTPANAMRLGIGLETAVPTGTARIGTTFILGGTIRMQYGITNNFAITFTSGAYHFLSKYIPGTSKRYNSYGVIPIKAGVKEFFTKNIYVGAEAGVGVEQTDNGVDPARLILSPGVGYANKHWDVGVRYENFSSIGDNYGLIGLRIAYGFGL